MENNLVELKFDRVNEYFEKFKKEYDADYEANKEKGTRTVIPYHKLITPTVSSGIVLIAFFIANHVSSVLPKTNSNDISDSSSHMSEILSSWVMPAVVLFFIAVFLITIVRVMVNSYEITDEYTKTEYYHKIKPRMLDKLRAELHNSITENMLIFDKNGLIIGPDLSKKENKRIFSEAERKLESKQS